MNTYPAGKEIQAIRELQSLAEGPYYGATPNTMLFGGMSFDNQQGKVQQDYTLDSPKPTWNSDEKSRARPILDRIAYVS